MIFNLRKLKLVVAEITYDGTWDKLFKSTVLSHPMGKIPSHGQACQNVSTMTIFVAKFESLIFLVITKHLSLLPHAINLVNFFK